MPLYDATNKTGLCQEIDRLCDTTDTSYTRLDKTARLNQSMEELVGEIIMVSGDWQYDDTNHTTEPVGTGNLVADQSSYSFATEYLTIEHIDVKNADGNWYRLDPMDRKDLQGMTPEEYFGTVSGAPEYYDKVGDTVRLYPSPAAANVTLTAGLRVTFKRAPQAFTAASTTDADTTKAGLPSSYHVLLAYMAAIPYCMSYKPERVALYEKKKDELKKKLLAFYGRRQQDKRDYFSTQRVAFR